MNCQQCQQRISDALAAGDVHVSPEVTAHQNSCPACTKFSATQQNLFDSIDETMQSLVNQPVPPSFLPTVRARLDENPVRQRSWPLIWNLAAVAALVAAAVILAYFWRKPTTLRTSPGQIAATAQAVPAAQQPPQSEQKSSEQPVVPSSPRHVALTPASAPTPKAIVATEERQAFAKFVAEAPQRPEIALAFTRPATRASDAPNETALLRIDFVEVKSLDGTEDE